MRMLSSIVALLLLLPVQAHGQTPVTPASTIAWDQQAPSLTAAQGYTYTLQVDGTRQPAPTTATCSGTSAPYTCQAAFPALTPGPHTIAVSAATVVNGVAAESAFSAPLSVLMVVAPAVPANLRIGQ
jgi:hypothetical protein